MVELKEIENEDYGKDLVEVVRCKDCKNGVCRGSVVACFEDVTLKTKLLDDYCSMGVRKEKQ